jgi:hypothetical protein
MPTLNETLERVLDLLLAEVLAGSDLGDLPLWYEMTDANTA